MIAEQDLNDWRVSSFEECTTIIGLSSKNDKKKIKFLSTSSVIFCEMITKKIWQSCINYSLSFSFCLGGKNLVQLIMAFMDRNPK